MDRFSRKQRRPAPHITIALDPKCSRLCRPGSRVTGTITLQSQSERQLRHGEAIFFGRTETHCARIGSAGTNGFGIIGRTNFSTNPTIHYHDDACLLRFTQELTEAITIEANETYDWRFEFVFGESAKLIGRSPYIGPTTSTGAYPDGLHPLPPTFNRYFNENHYALVEYRIQVVFLFTDVEQPYTVVLPLEFLPNSSWPDPSALVESPGSPETFSSARLLENRRSVTHSLRGKSSYSAPPPSVNVTIKTSVNKQVIRSSMMPIYACVELRDFSSPAISIPQVEIRIKALKLHQVTFFRGRDVSSAYGPGEYQEIGEDSISLTATPEYVLAESKGRSEDEERFCFYAATLQARIPETIPPTFRTFNINHHYQLTGTVVASICGKKFEHEFMISSIVILLSS